MADDVTDEPCAYGKLDLKIKSCQDCYLKLACKKAPQNSESKKV